MADVPDRARFPAATHETITQIMMTTNFRSFRGAAIADTASPTTMATRTKRTIAAAKITRGSAMAALTTTARLAVTAKDASAITRQPRATVNWTAAASK